MLFNIIILAFYWQMLFLGSIESSTPKELIPDLNFPPPIEQGDVPHTQTSREIFKNKNHDKPEISVEIEPLPPNHHETGLFQTQKSMTVKGKVYYSDEKRKEWKERKRAQRELLKDDVRKAIYRKEYYQKKEKVEKLEPHLLAEHKALKKAKSKQNYQRTRAKQAASKKNNLKKTKS